MIRKALSEFDYNGVLLTWEHLRNFRLKLCNQHSYFKYIDLRTIVIIWLTKVLRDIDDGKAWTAIFLSKYLTFKYGSL